MKIKVFLLLMFLWVSADRVAAEQLLVVVNPLSGLSRLSQSEVINLYMGRQKKLGNQTTAIPLELAGNNALKRSFYAGLMGKDLSEINSYWARLIFSGQGSPPRQLESLADIQQAVRDNLGAIGYVPDSESVADLKVVFEMQIK